MVFPPNCVESTLPLMMKRRKHCKMDVQLVEGWRLVMSLRSGLVMESTWALDVLNILLYDDNAFQYFGLGNMPGLFEVLMEHWRAALIAMFGLTEDMEAGRPKGDSRVASIAHDKKGEEEEPRRSEQKRKWWERRDRTRQEGKEEEGEEEGELELGRPGRIAASDRCPVLHGADLTKRPRFSEKEFLVEQEEDVLFVTDEERPWDVSSDGQDELSSEHWRLGGGNTTMHVVASFAADLGLVPFVRLLKEMGGKKTEEQGEEDSEVAKSEEKVSVKQHQQPAEGGEEKTEEEVGEKEEEEEEEEPEDIVDKIHRLTGIVLRDPEAARRRWKDSSLEEECYMRDEPSLHLTTEEQDNLGRRAVCVSTILRNLSFLPGNEYEFGRSAAFLTVAGRLLLLYHWYPARTARQRNYDRGEEEEGASESCSSLVGDAEWWWDHLHVIRENVMVVLANVAGSLELRQFDESVARPILHGLLEWAVSSSSYAQDPFPYMGTHSPVSPQRLAVETLCKLCVHEANVDLLLTTPPFSRIERLSRLLCRRLYRYEDQVLREFSINLLYYMSGADTGMSRSIVMRADQTVGLLLGFIEQAEQNAMMVAQQHGVNALRDNPDSMGTSLDMLRRAASTLHNFSRHPDNIPLFVKHEQRLLALVMSQILDQGVAAILSSVLFYIGQEQEEMQRQEKKAAAEREQREKEEAESKKEKEAASEAAETAAAAAAAAEKDGEDGSAAPDAKEEPAEPAGPTDSNPESQVAPVGPSNPSSSSGGGDPAGATAAPLVASAS